MDLVILHYHLNRGGVTQVIRSHIDAIKLQSAAHRPARVHLLYDGQHDGWDPEVLDSEDLPVTRHVLPGLAYQERPVDASRALFAEINRYLASWKLRPGRCVIHVHNPTLGKTASLPGMVRRLAEAGHRLLLHPHDFAEDMRPENYRLLADALGGAANLPRQLYFHAPHVHWAVLNHRDLAILRRAGIPHDRLHWLPNPVRATADETVSWEEARRDVAAALSFPPERRFLLYPVRGIRRKNVGELLLLAALLGDTTFSALTLAPQNPRERPVYEHWRQVAEREGLPIDLESAARGVPFATQRAAADWVVTTSVAEGFGLAFLETWLAGRPLAGRDLPEITRPFVEAGIVFDGLTDALRIPVAWCGKDRVLSGLLQKYGELLAAYGRTKLQQKRLLDQAEDLVRDGSIDFAHCDVAVQTDVIGAVAASSARRGELLEINPLWNRIASGWTVSAEMIRSNAERVESTFGFFPIGKRLTRLYRELFAEAPGNVEPFPSPASILDAFLQLSRVHPIRLS